MPITPRSSSSPRPLAATTKQGGGAKQSSSSSLSGTSDFTILTTRKRQAIMLIYGDSKTGKTTFCTRYMPDPTAIINLDRRAEAAVLKAQEEYDKHIHFLKCGMPPSILRRSPNEIQLAALDLSDKIIRNFEWAAEQSLKGNIRSIFIDTATELTDIWKLCYDGTLAQTKEGSYGRDKDYVNRQWRNLFEIARDSNAHFIITARASEIWVSVVKSGKKVQEATGNFKPKCPSTVLDGVDWAGNIRLKKGAKGRLRKEFELEITSAGENIEELGKVYTAEDWEDLGGPFVFSCLMQYPGSVPQDWI